MNPFKSSFIAKNIILFLGDSLIAFISFYMGVFIRFYNSGPHQLDQYSPLLPRAITFSMFILFMGFLMDLYGIGRGEGRKERILKIIFAGILAALALAAFYYLVPSLRIGRGILFIAICVSIGVQSLWHIGYDLFLNLPGVAKRVLILGTGPIAKTIGKVLTTNNNGFALSGYVNCVNEPVLVPHNAVVGNGEGLLSIALKEKAQKIVVSLTERRGTFPLKEVLSCKLKGIDVVDGPSFYEQMTGKLLVENINPSYLIFSDGFRLTPFKRYFKRLFDVVFSIIGIIFSLPFLFVVPILIKLDSKGPVLLKQKRVGEGEKIFTLYKFRTMVEDAEKDTGPVWSKAGDTRVTRIGRFLRKSRLDEIPQLFNVLRGDMSFIGPRPERPFFVESLKKQIPYYSERHCVKPGITGWAQVRYEYGDSVEDALEKLRYDLYYIKHLSIFLDILIILDTIKVILFGRGGR
jgi:sugar transferase (PEP-CTERM system associated)